MLGQRRLKDKEEKELKCGPVGLGLESLVARTLLYLNNKLLTHPTNNNNYNILAPAPPLQNSLSSYPPHPLRLPEAFNPPTSSSPHQRHQAV